jgi:hypothetical protein
MVEKTSLSLQVVWAGYVHSEGTPKQRKEVFTDCGDMFAEQVNLISFPQRNELLTQKPDFITLGILDAQLLAEDSKSVPVNFVHPAPGFIFDPEVIAKGHEFFAD